MRTFSKKSTAEPEAVEPADPLAAKLAEIETSLATLGIEIEEDRSAFPTMVIERGADSSDVLAAQRDIAGKRERYSALEAARTEMLRRIEQRDAEREAAAGQAVVDAYYAQYDGPTVEALKALQSDIERVVEGSGAKAIAALKELAARSPISKPLSFHSPERSEGGDIILNDEFVLRRHLSDALFRQLILAGLLPGAAGQGPRNIVDAVDKAYQHQRALFERYRPRAE